MSKYHRFQETLKKQKSAIIYLSIFAVICIVGIVVLLLVGEPNDSSKRNRSDKIVKIGGVDCVPKQNIETYLFMGTDVRGKITDNMKDNPGQADTIIVLVIDREKNTYALLPIDRDTITDVDSLDENGNFLATTKTQLALAHACGNGEEQSCENTMKAVSILLHDQYIDDYTSVTMDAIKKLNHLVGGVTVTIKDDFSKSDKSLKKGKTIKLNDKQAMHYVHDRINVGDGTNECRMRRQDEYMAGLKNIFTKQTKTNKSFPVDVFKGLDDYMVTSLSGDSVSKISKAVLKNKYLGKFRIKGHSKIDRDRFNAFYYDQKSLDEVVRKLFYDEVDKHGNIKE